MGGPWGGRLGLGPWGSRAHGSPRLSRGLSPRAARRPHPGHVNLRGDPRPSRAQHPLFFVLGGWEQAGRIRRFSFIPSLIDSTRSPELPLGRRSPRPDAVLGPLPFLTGSSPPLAAHPIDGETEAQKGRLILSWASLAWKPCPSPAQNKEHPRKRAEGWEKG